jgi:hypothetical protein
MASIQSRNAAIPFAGNYYDANIIGLSSMSSIFFDSTVCLLVSDVLHLSVILFLYFYTFEFPFSLLWNARN